MKTESQKKQDRIRNKLKERLSLNNIHKEHDLIIHFNKHMQIPLRHLHQLDILQTLSKEDVIKIIKSISFLKYIHHSEHSRRECVRIDYDNSGRTLLVTGIQKQYIERTISNFNNRRYGQPFSKSPNSKIIHSNSFWLAIQTSSEQTASGLKKYLRNQKRSMDEKEKRADYKIERKRIRIVIVKQDLFTILVDAMTEYKSELFQQNFYPAEYTQKKDVSTIIYRPLIYNNYYTTQKNQKQEQLSDGFSESNSLNSDLFDPNKIKDIIQTSDQGIQSENNIPLAVNEEPQDTTGQQMHSSPNLPSKNDLNIINQKGIQQTKNETNDKVHDIFQSPHRKRESSLEGICTQKSSPFYNQYQGNSEIPRPSQFSHSYSVQTEQPLYSIIPDRLMRKLLLQFKSKPHNKLVELPDWLKSESQTERNRHRFFNSLCKPKLTHKNNPF